MQLWKSGKIQVTWDERLLTMNPCNKVPRFNTTIFIQNKPQTDLRWITLLPKKLMQHVKSNSFLLNHHYYPSVAKLDSFNQSSITKTSYAQGSPSRVSGSTWSAKWLRVPSQRSKGYWGLVWQNMIPEKTKRGHLSQPRDICYNKQFDARVRDSDKYVSFNKQQHAYCVERKGKFISLLDGTISFDLPLDVDSYNCNND